MAVAGVVIVTYNSAREIGECLDAALAFGLEAVVVDNASRDETVAIARARGAALIANAENRGFAAAANQGIAALPRPLVLLLNPDAVLRSSPEALIRVFDDPRVGAAGGLLTDADGTPQAGFTFRALPDAWALSFEALGVNRLWPRNPVNWHYRCLGLRLDEAQNVEQPAGALLMIRRAAWAEAGGFDEAFHPIWFEDVDFAKKLLVRGWSIRYEPGTVACHTGAHSIRPLPVQARQLYWYRGFLRYAGKHLRPLPFRAVCLSVVAGSFLRMLSGFVRDRGLQGAPVYWRIARFAVGCFFSPRRAGANGVY